MTLTDLRDALIAAAALVYGGRRMIDSAMPIIGPPLRALRERILRDLLARVGALERRVDIIEAVQSAKDGD